MTRQLSRRELLASAGAIGGMAMSPTVTEAQTLPPPPIRPMPGARVPMESQGWWMPQSGHLHLALAAPVGQVVSDTIGLDFRIVLHASDIRVYRFGVNILQNYTQHYEYVYPLDLYATAHIQAWDFHLDLNTRLYKDGWRLLQFGVRGQGPLNQLSTNLFFPVYVQNAQPQAGMDTSLLPTNGHGVQTLTGMQAQGWPGAQGFNYQKVFWDDVPRRPVSGLFAPRVKCDAFPRCRLIVELDTDHGVPATAKWPEQPQTHGQTLFDSTDDHYKWRAMPIDTTSLSNGWHWLTARHERTRDIGPGGDVASGVAKFWFYVDNANGPREPFSVAY